MPDSHQTRDKFIGRLYILIATLLWSTGGFFAKSPIFDDWAQLDRGPMIAFWRVFFAGLILLPFARGIRWRPTLVPLAISFASMNILYILGMALTTSANTIWLQSISPWWAFVFSILIFHEAFHRRDLISLIFGGLGVGFILFFEIQNSGNQSIAGSCSALFSGIGMAGVYVCMRHLRHENGAWLVAFSQLSGAVILLPWIIYHHLYPSLPQLLVLVAFGLVQMAAPYFLLTQGLKRIGSVEAITINLLEPILLPLWVFLSWGEVPAWWTIVGAIFILTGLCLRYFVFKSE